MSDSVYKVLTQPQWYALESDGEFTGSQDDLEDGFIHLSTIEQYNGVIDRFFKGIRPLYIVEFTAADFGDALKWESAKSGELFPHVYNRPLKQTEILGVEVLE